MSEMTRKQLLIQVLKGARERVRKGWLQGASSNHLNTKVCAAEALMRSVQEQTNTDVAYAAQLSNQWVLRGAFDYTGKAWPTIPQWNDEDGRTQDEVVETFDRALKLVERDFDE